MYFYDKKKKKNCEIFNKLRLYLFRDISVTQLNFCTISFGNSRKYRLKSLRKSPTERIPSIIPTRGLHRPGPGRAGLADERSLFQRAGPGRQMRDDFSNGPGRPGTWGVIFFNGPGRAGTWEVIFRTGRAGPAKREMSFLTAESSYEKRKTTNLTIQSGLTKQRRSFETYR